jgi:hypothetical protein
LLLCREAYGYIKAQFVVCAALGLLNDFYVR